MAIYLDQAATSFPKPPQVPAQMVHYLTHVGATVNRASYAPAQEAAMTALSLRERLCRLLGYGGRPTHAILTAGCTMSLNLLLRGWLRPGDHCVVSAMEHNAVMRPLTDLGVAFDRIPCNGEGLLDPDDLAPLLRPNTRLVLVAHASNVSGAIQDAAALGVVCAAHGVPFALDAAQSAGHIPVDFDAFGCSAVVVPGHKGLLGPGGIGGLLLHPSLAKAMRPLVTGGTGSASQEERQPDFLPDKFESGTANLPGIYGWEAALAFLEDLTVDRVRAHDLVLIRRFLDGLRQISGIRLAGPTDPDCRVGVFSLDFPGQDNGLVTSRLEREFGILTRCGLHCAPSAHKTLGTYPGGTVRFSFGWYNTEAEIDAALDAIDRIACGV